MSEFEVVYNGALERERAQAQQRHVERKPAPRATERVIAALKALPESTLPELADACALDQHAVNAALWVLRQHGLVEFGKRFRTSKHGRLCRTYRLTES